MDKKQFIRLLIVVALVAQFLIVFIPSVSADSFYTTKSTTESDGYITKSSGTYSTAQSYPTGTPYDIETRLFVGQTMEGASHAIYRSFVFFDTSSIPDTATINNATLSLYATGNYSDTDFNVTIQNGQTTYPHDPLESGDYYYDHYSGNGGNRSTSEYVAGYWNITLTESGLDMIQVDGTTKLCLRSSRDIAATENSGNEYVIFRGSEWGSQQPLLIIGFTVESGEYYQYIFYGPFNEETGAVMDETVNVSAYNIEGGAFENFTLDESETFYTYLLVQYFRFTFEDNSTREYWIDPSESSYAVIYVFWGDTTTYSISFLDTTGLLDTYPYVDFKRYVNGTLHTVEKRKADAYDSVIANLINTRTYSIYLGNEDVTYVFGDLTVTSLTTIQLTLRGVDFPKATLLKENLRCYVKRSTGTTINIYYLDSLFDTTSITVKIYDEDGDLKYSNTYSSYSLSLAWASAVNTTDYLVDLDISHITYGTLDFKQYVLGEADEVTFDLSFLGDWSFDSTMLIPSLLVLCVAGCFSKLNAHIGAILMVVAAGVLSAIGWFPVPVGMLVVAFALAILMALLYSKRRVTIQ